MVKEEYNKSLFQTNQLVAELHEKLNEIKYEREIKNQEEKQFQKIQILFLQEMEQAKNEIEKQKLVIPNEIEKIKQIFQQEIEDKNNIFKKRMELINNENEDLMKSFKKEKEEQNQIYQKELKKLHHFHHVYRGMVYTYATF